MLRLPNACVFAALWLVPSALAQQQTSVLFPPGVFLTDGFGHSIARDGDRLLVGAPWGGVTIGSQGVVYAFRRTPTGWSSDGVLAASDAAPGKAFGWAVDLEGDIAVIGSPDDGEGSAYVFEWVDLVGWVERHKLKPSGGSSGPGSGFGSAVAISQPRILVGAPWEDTVAGISAGAVYAFVQGLFGIFVQEDRLVPLVGDDVAGFGDSLDLVGDAALIGAPLHTETAYQGGAAYRFVRSTGSGWAEAQKLLPSTAYAGAKFGSAVDLLAGKRAVIGAPSVASSLSVEPAVHVFLPGILTPSWFELTRLTPMSPQPESEFGFSVAQQGDRILVGARRWDAGASKSGAVFLYDLEGSSWMQTALLSADHPGSQEQLGSAVAFGDEEAIAGAPWSAGPGLAYTFDLDLDPDPYGCGLNPEGSLVELEGAPDLADTWKLGIHNPLGTQAPNSSALLVLRTEPDGLYPCGTFIPGWGMAAPGATGELLVEPKAPGLVAGPVLWDGIHPAPLGVSVPPDPILVSQRVYVQGVLVDPTGSGVPIALTEALEAVIGP